MLSCLQLYELHTLSPDFLLKNIWFDAEQLIPANHSFQEACNAWPYMTFLPALDVEVKLWQLCSLSGTSKKFYPTYLEIWLKHCAFTFPHPTWLHYNLCFIHTMYGYSNESKHLYLCFPITVLILNRFALWQPSNQFSISIISAKWLLEKWCDKTVQIHSYSTCFFYYNFNAYPNHVLVSAKSSSDHSERNWEPGGTWIAYTTHYTVFRKSYSATKKQVLYHHTLWPLTSMNACLCL